MEHPDIKFTVCLAIQKGEFTTPKGGKAPKESSEVVESFKGFRSTTVHHQHQKTVTILFKDINFDEQTIPLYPVLIACCEIVIAANENHEMKELLPVRIGQGINVWLGDENFECKGRKSSGNIKPLLYSDFKENEEFVSYHERR